MTAMTLVAALDVASLAVQAVIRDISYAHKSVWLFVPVTHAIAGKMQTLIEKGPQTRTFRLGRPGERAYH